MSRNQKVNQRDQFKTSDIYKYTIKEVVESLRSDEIADEYNMGKTKDMSHPKWKEVLVKLYELGKSKLKVIKKTKEPFKEEVLRTVFKSSQHPVTSELIYSFEKESVELLQKKEVFISKDRMGSLQDIKSIWDEMTTYMCNLYDFYENNIEDPNSSIKVPKNDIQTHLKKFDVEYESYVKGRTVIFSADKRDLEPGEPMVGGFTYCQWLLNRNFLDQIYGLIRYSRYYRSIFNRLELEPGSVPEFRTKSIFSMYMKYFIDVFSILYNNPRGEERFLKIPNSQILGYFVTFDMKKSMPEIVKYYLTPFQESIVKLEYELNELQKNELYRIKIDLNNNIPFYNEMKKFDGYYYRAYKLMAFDYRYDQLNFIYETIEWLYRNEYIRKYFTLEDNEMKICLIEELIPILVAYNSIIKYRQYLDVKKTGKLKLKYDENSSVDTVLTDKEKEDVDIRDLTRHEIASKEYYEKDKKTNTTYSWREFLLEEIVSDKNREEFQSWLYSCACRMYDIREDVRIYIKCDIIMSIWSRVKNDDLEECRKQETKKKESNRQGYKKIVTRIEETRKDGKDIDNFCPHLQEYEEQKLLVDGRLEPLGKHLSMTKLKTPHVYNNVKYKNEDRFSTLFNSNNCYEDNRVKLMLDEMYAHIVPELMKNEVLNYFILSVFDFFINQSLKKVEK